MEILKRDIDIYYQTWGEKEKPRLAIQIFHGMSEHISRYEDFAGFLGNYGILAYGMDIRGHGNTGANSSSLGYFADDNGWNVVLDDQKAFTIYSRRNIPIYPFA